jgi:hypothetical protein
VRAVDIGRKIGGTLSASFALTLLSAVPWIVFGPITGCMTFRALQCLRAGRPMRGLAWLGANIAILLAIPALTILLARSIKA